MADLHEEITRILQDWGSRDEDALHKLLPVVFDDLRRMARYYFRRELPGHTLQPTAVVNEVYLRLLGSRIDGFESREQFFSIASRLIREILVDYARARKTDKRGGNVPKVGLEAAFALEHKAHLDPETLVTLNEALSRLSKIAPRQSRLVELRYFTGLTLPEAAEVIGVSRATAERDWSVARRWLARALRDD